MRASKTATRRLAFGVDYVDSITQALGLKNDPDKARFFRVSLSSYHRTSRGQRRPSERFIASVVATFDDPDVKTRLIAAGLDPDVRFEQLFPVEEVAA
jgi:hypothetical protein